MKIVKDIFITLLILGLLGGTIFIMYRYVIPEEVISTVKDNLGFYEDSGITGDDIEIDEEFYPYYGYLSDDCKVLYKQIYANVMAMKTSIVPCVELTVNEVVNVINAVYHDHPEAFWMESGYSYKYTKENICVHVMLEFNETADDIEDCKRLFDEVANRIIEGTSALSTDYEKEWYVYRKIIEGTEYDENALIHQSPYSALVYGKSVCAGYARAFQYIMLELGIPTYYCTGENAGHAWAIVKLDGGYYNVDPSREDTRNTTASYFNRTDEDLRGTHKRSGYSTLLPRCRSKKYSVSE